MKNRYVSRILSIKWILALLLSLIIQSCQKSGITLVKRSVSEYSIVIPDESEVIVVKAASELQHYMQQLTGAELPIVSGAKHPAIHLRLEGQELGTVSYRVEEEDLIIAGGSSEALRNAVYVFMEEQAGIRWWAPGEFWIPKMKRFAIPKDLSYSYTPDIQVRTVHSRLFYEHPEFAAQLRVTTEAFPSYVPDARVHTFHRFLPEDEYFDAHPEYYAFRNSRRIPTQLCLTNPTVLDLVKEAVGEYFERSPDASVISVSTNDNTQYCQCPSCAAMDEEEGGPTGTLLNFVNAVAREYPDKMVSTLAYQYTRKPSKVVPEKNVLITLCSIECDRSGSIEEKCVEFAEDLRGWKDLTDNVRIWDYTTQFTNFLAPFPNMHTLEPNIRFFRDNNARWIFEQHSRNPSELFELRSYVMAKLLWNPDLEYDALLDEFTRGYYGAAGPHIREYVNLIHQKIREYPEFFLFLYGDPSQGFDSFLNPDLLLTYKHLFDEAEAAVGHDENLLFRVRKARLSTDYAWLEAAKKGLTDELSLVMEVDGDKIPNANMMALLDQFEQTCVKADITLMNEMGFTVQEYLDNYRKTVEVAIRPNLAKGKPVTLLTRPKKYANEDPMVLTDGALGGNNFYSNWLGFEGNSMEAIIDLETPTEVSSVSMAFLQVTNHIVFYPLEVEIFGADETGVFELLSQLKNPRPLTKESKVNDIQYFDFEFDKRVIQQIKIRAVNQNVAPIWHHAAGLPAWIFTDEIIIN